ncbi:3455_t:CDS:2 [Acaulospora colombiana]|uniref:3455_t:CDS:1 n=1 Tax=Acaulospora colombiana TaxID=27376 RepID=A0ACA9KE83_9GLOM|nr:3455_t:CDS:2 [Acaulospora colombiana]
MISISIVILLDQRTHFPPSPYFNTNASSSTHPKIHPLDLPPSPKDQFPKHQVVDKEFANMHPRLPSLASAIGSTVMHSGGINIRSLLSPPESPDKETSFEEQSHACSRRHHNHNHHDNCVRAPSTIHRSPPTIHRSPPTIHRSPPTPSTMYQNLPYPTYSQQQEHGYSRNRDCDDYSTSHSVLQSTLTPPEHRSTSSVTTAPATSTPHQEIPVSLVGGGSDRARATSPNDNMSTSNCEVLKKQVEIKDEIIRSKEEKISRLQESLIKIQQELIKVLKVKNGNSGDQMGSPSSQIPASIIPISIDDTTTSRSLIDIENSESESEWYQPSLRREFRVYIGHVTDITKQRLKRELEENFGQVVEVEKIINKNCAFATFATRESYNMAINRGIIYVDGHDCCIEQPRPRNNEDFENKGRRRRKG